MSRILAKTQPDIVHAHNWAINSVLPLPRRSASRPPYGLVLTLHDYSLVCATKRLMRAGAQCPGPSLARCLPCATDHYGPLIGSATVAATAAMRPWKTHSIDYIVSVSRAVAAGNRVANQEASGIIPNFIPESIVLSPSGSSPRLLSATAADIELPDGNFLLFVGDLSAEKGVHILLRAYECLGTKRPPLVLIGRRTADTPRDLPDGTQLRLDWPHEDVLEAFRRCTVAVLPSVWPDPCPTTVLEAMASGCPVVATSIGGITDMVINEESGLLVSPGNVSELATAVGRLLADEGLRSRLAAAAQNRVLQFTATAVAERLEAVYAQVAAARR
jgi:glycogen synthase